MPTPAPNYRPSAERPRPAGKTGIEKTDETPPATTRDTGSKERSARRIAFLLRQALDNR